MPSAKMVAQKPVGNFSPLSSPGRMRWRMAPQAVCLGRMPGAVCPPAAEKRHRNPQLSKAT